MGGGEADHAKMAQQGFKTTKSSSKIAENAIHKRKRSLWPSLSTCVAECEKDTKHRAVGNIKKFHIFYGSPYRWVRIFFYSTVCPRLKVWDTWTASEFAAAIQKSFSVWRTAYNYLWIPKLMRPLCCQEIFSSMSFIKEWNSSKLKNLKSILWTK